MYVTAQQEELQRVEEELQATRELVRILQKKLDEWDHQQRSRYVWIVNKHWYTYSEKTRQAEPSPEGLSRT